MKWIVLVLRIEFYRSIWICNGNRIMKECIEHVNHRSVCLCAEDHMKIAVFFSMFIEIGALILSWSNCERVHKLRGGSWKRPSLHLCVVLRCACAVCPLLWSWLVLIWNGILIHTKWTSKSQLIGMFKSNLPDTQMSLTHIAESVGGAFDKNRFINNELFVFTKCNYNIH